MELQSKKAVKTTCITLHQALQCHWQSAGATVSAISILSLPQRHWQSAYATADANTQNASMCGQLLMQNMPLTTLLSKKTSTRM